MYLVWPYLFSIKEWRVKTVHLVICVWIHIHRKNILQIATVSLLGSKQFFKNNLYYSTDCIEPGAY